MITNDVKTYFLEHDFKIKIRSMPRFKITWLYTNLITDDGIEKPRLRVRIN